MATLKVSIRKDGCTFTYTDRLEAKGFRTAYIDSETRKEVYPGGQPAASSAAEPALPDDLPVLSMTGAGSTLEAAADITLDDLPESPWKAVLMDLATPEALRLHAQTVFFMDLPPTLSFGQARHIVDKTYQAVANAVEKALKPKPDQEAPADGTRAPGADEAAPAPERPEVAALQTMAEMREHAIEVFGVQPPAKTKEEMRSRLNEMYRQRDREAGKA